MMNEICKNTFKIWRFWKKNFHVWVLQNNSYLDRLKNVIKNQIFQKNESLRLMYELKFAEELIPGLIKSKIDVWKHILIPWYYCLLPFLCNFGIHKFCAYSTPKICGFRFLSFVLDLSADEKLLWVFGTFQTCFEVVFPWKVVINFAYFHLWV